MEEAVADQEKTGSTLPELECDLIMRGGVTSGVVYPGATSEIAKLYRLRSIGGTSAGALAAAGAAAMEFGRSSGRNADALDTLAAIPTRLAECEGSEPLLARLFDPDPSTKPLYDLLLGLAAGKVSILKSPLLRKLVFAILKVPFSIALLSSTVLVALLQLANPARTGWDWAERGLLFLSAALTLTVLAGFLTPKLARLRSWLEDVLRPVAGYGFGLCSGWARQSGADAPPSLAGWAHQTIQELAGLPADEPLTFGDLWTAPYRKEGASREMAFAAARQAAAKSQHEDIALCPRQIDLTLIASDLNRHMLIQLPFLKQADLFVRISDLAALFPPQIVSWMREHSGPVSMEGVDLGSVPPEDLISLPRPEDLPVLFAARMSLSFPVLFRAVRLYLVRRKSPAGPAMLVELWLSDGGITSNFPIHLFDSPIPMRPTLCLNLLAHDEEISLEGMDEDGSGAAGDKALLRTSGAAAVDRRPSLYMPNSNEGRIDFIRQSTGEGPLDRLRHFVGLVFDTSRIWNDTMAMDVPGYRDRIIHIWMREDEGGFNIRMTRDQILELDRRGKEAGRMIAQRFLPGQKDDPLRPGRPLRLGWANHRFVRLRSFLAAVELVAARFARPWKRGSSAAGDQAGTGIDVMLDKAGRATEPPFMHLGFPPESDAQRRLLQEMVEALRAFSALSEDKPATADFVDGKPTSPRPKPALRLRPALDTDPLNERRP